MEFYKNAKTPYVLTPRGKPLFDDSNRFGTKMLEKMGWSKGKGLGANLDGNKDFIRLKSNAAGSQRGYGFTDRDDQWTQHEDDFNALLKSFHTSEKSAESSDSGNNDTNVSMGFGFKRDKKVKTSEKQSVFSGVSLEEQSKLSKARVHYKKFTRGKDMSRYSEQDLANIFGKKTLVKESTVIESTPAPIEPVIESNPSETKTFGIPVIHAKLTIGDYFKAKMEAKQLALRGPAGDTIKNPFYIYKSEEPKQSAEEQIKDCVVEDNGNNEQISKKKKKRKHEESIQINEEQQISEASAETENEQISKKKKKRKRDYEEIVQEESIPELTTTKKEKKLKKKRVLQEEENTLLIEKPVKEKKIKKAAFLDSADYNFIEAKVQVKNGFENENFAIPDFADNSSSPSRHCSDGTALKKKKLNATLEHDDNEQEHPPKSKTKKSKYINVEADEVSTDSNPKKIKKNKKFAVENQCDESGDMQQLEEPTELIRKKNKKDKKKKLLDDIEVNEKMHIPKFLSNVLTILYDQNVAANTVATDDVDNNIDADSSPAAPTIDSTIKDIFEIAKYKAEIFRFLDLDGFTKSNLSDIPGYGYSKNLQLKVVTGFRDDSRIIDFWDKALINKYGQDAVQVKKNFKKKKYNIKTLQKKNVFKF